MAHIRFVPIPALFDVSPGDGVAVLGQVKALASIITEAKVSTVIMLASTSAVIDKSQYFVRTGCTLAQSSAIIADWTARNGQRRWRLSWF
jgi:hypothetical protein